MIFSDGLGKGGGNLVSARGRNSLSAGKNAHYALSGTHQEHPGLDQ